MSRLLRCMFFWCDWKGLSTSNGAKAPVGRKTMASTRMIEYRILLLVGFGNDDKTYIFGDAYDFSWKKKIIIIIQLSITTAIRMYKINHIDTDIVVYVIIFRKDIGR